MARKYRFLFVAYRWGDDPTGGAEIHHRRLVKDLIELGHNVEVWTNFRKSDMEKMECLQGQVLKRLIERHYNNKAK